VRWLAEGSVAALAGALREVAPELAGYPIVIPGKVGQEDPQWWSATALVGGEFVAKFAWSRTAALRVRHEIGVLTALARPPAVPYLPEVVVGSTDPLLLVTRRVPGAPLFAVADSIDRDQAGRQLARFLAALHHPSARARVEAETGPLAAARPLAATSVLRDRFAAWVSPGQHQSVVRWCDWADAVLTQPGPPGPAEPAGRAEPHGPAGSTVLVHADLHGNNQVWDHGELRVVVDFETVAAAEPEYDLSGFPGPGLGPGVELLTATVRHYEEAAGRPLSVERIMAWHVRQALGDVLWRTDAGIHLADHRTPPDWVDDLAVRFRTLGLAP
jgi:aminoglycoside phosphotransferase (APT) family kinase protein